MLRNLDIFKLETPSHTTRRVALANGGEAFPYSDLSVGRIEGFQRTIPALVSDGVADGDNWYVVNLIDASNGMSRYVQSVAVLGATSEDQARGWALKNIGLFVGANDAWTTAYTSTKVLKTYLNRPSTSVAMIAIRQSDLDTIAAQITDKPVVWDGSRLMSHDPSTLLHELVKHDDEVTMMDAMTPNDLSILMIQMGGEIAEYDALITDYNRLDLLMSRLKAAMLKSSVGNVKPVDFTQSKPFKKNGVTNVAALFEMSDGQSVTIVFHSPDNTPAKLAPSDTLTSWKWMLNKRDISAAVSPKNGENVQMPDLAKRILTIVEKNSARFTRTNGNKAAQVQELADTNTRIGQKQEALAGILAINKDLQKQIDDAGKQTVPVVAKQEPKTDSNGRPKNWRATLPYARAVAKSLGIETKGKKLDRLLREIDIFDEKEVKKELLSEFKALASRLVLPKGYVFDLSDAEKSIGDITRWVSPIIKQKGAFDFNKIRIELRAVTSINEYEGGVYISDYVFFYTEDKNAKKDMDSLNYPNDGNINASEPKTPKATVEKMEQFLIKAVFPKIEYLKVVNGTELDPSKLSELGIANIESIGNENIYIEKNGKYYISKVGNTEDYVLGEWDFAQYPEGKPAAPVTQPEQALVESALDALEKLSKNTNFDSWSKKHGVDEGVAQSILDANVNSALLFGLITHDLPPNDELLKFQNYDILTYYRAKAEDVKALSDEAFGLLLNQDDYGEKTNYLAYSILRNSNKKAELDYVSSLGAMNNRFRLDAQKYGGKLYKMAQPYLSSQPVEAQPEPANEPPMTNPDRDYLQSIIDGKVSIESTSDIKAVQVELKRIDAELESNPNPEIDELLDQSFSLVKIAAKKAMLAAA